MSENTSQDITFLQDKLKENLLIIKQTAQVITSSIVFYSKYNVVLNSDQQNHVDEFNVN